MRVRLTLLLAVLLIAGCSSDGMPKAEQALHFRAIDLGRKVWIAAESGDEKKLAELCDEATQFKAEVLAYSERVTDPTESGWGASWTACDLEVTISEHNFGGFARVYTQLLGELRCLETDSKAARDYLCSQLGPS